MARARNIKPKIMENEDLAECQPLARLLFVYLWMLADREGRLEDRPKRIAAQALPYDRGADVDAMLNELVAADFILRYTAAGVAIIQILKFAKHQAPHVRESPSELPGPDEADAKPVQNTTKAVLEHNLGNAEASPRSPDSLIPSSLIPSSGLPDTAAAAADARATPKERGRRENARGIDAHTELPDVLPQVVTDWLQVRKDKGAKSLTATGLADIRRQAVKAGLSMQDALTMCCRRNWVGFDAKWVNGSNGQGAPPNGSMTPYQQMQVEKHEQNKRFNAAITGRKSDERTDAIDGTAERVD